MDSLGTFHFNVSRVLFVFDEFHYGSEIQSLANSEKPLVPDAKLLLKKPHFVQYLKEACTCMLNVFAMAVTGVEALNIEP